MDCIKWTYNREVIPLRLNVRIFLETAERILIKCGILDIH